MAGKGYTCDAPQHNGKATKRKVRIFGLSQSSVDECCRRQGETGKKHRVMEVTVTGKMLRISSISYRLPHYAMCVFVCVVGAWAEWFLWLTDEHG